MEAGLPLPDLFLSKESLCRHRPFLANGKSYVSIPDGVTFKTIEAENPHAFLTISQWERLDAFVLDTIRGASRWVYGLADEYENLFLDLDRVPAAEAKTELVSESEDKPQYEMTSLPLQTVYANFDVDHLFVWNAEDAAKEVGKLLDENLLHTLAKTKGLTIARSSVGARNKLRNNHYHGPYAFAGKYHLQATPDAIRFIVACIPTPVQVGPKHFKVVASITPQIRSNYEGAVGVVEVSNI